MSINTKTLAVAVLLPVAMAALVQAHAADYNYHGAAAPEYYRSTNYEDRYNEVHNSFVPFHQGLFLANRIHQIRRQTDLQAAKLR